MLDADLPAGYTCFYRSTSAGSVWVHERHGKQEIHQNLPIAIFLAERGEQVWLLPVSNAPGAKNPDATRDGVEWEFKNPEGLTANAVDKALRSANKQASRVLIRVSSDLSIIQLEQALFSRVRRTDGLLEIAILRQNQLYHFNRQEIINNTFRGKII